MASPTNCAAAAKAGLRAEDLIVDLNGEPVDGVDDLQRLMAGELIGERVTVGTVRNGRIQRVELVPVELASASDLGAQGGWDADARRHLSAAAGALQNST
mgnify:CR=1 FL=1